MGKRSQLAACAALALGASCGQTPPSPPPCDPIAAQQSDAGLPDDTVWGFADLHSHPAIERAFGGALIWGSAVDGAPLNAAELPRIEPCPVETHLQPGASPINRKVGGTIFPAVAQAASFAHAPVGTLGYRPTSAWPNARDVIHQQMNVASIRRAYEGGLRLMFASTTDDQVLAALLAGPNFVNGFVPDPLADYQSAKRQLELILKIVAQNSSWMEIARSPTEARSIIRSGRLALVLSIEMNGYGDGEVHQLRTDYGVRHVFPVHLIDNNVGGTAAASQLFNSASAAVSSLYRSDHLPMQYMNLVATAEYPHSLDRPQTIGTGDPAPVYVALNDIPYSEYLKLCYEPLAACAGVNATPTSFIEFGQQNLRGLVTTEKELDARVRPGAQRIREMMDDQMIIDVSHMGARSVTETIAIDARYPLIASHGDIAHLCEGAPTQPPCIDSTRFPLTERQLDGEAAREIVRRHGVLGLGLGAGAYDARAVLVARGVPLFTLDPSTGTTAGCIAERRADGGPTDGCELIPGVDLLDAGTSLTKLKIETVGGISGYGPNAHPFVRVELRDPLRGDQFQRHVVIAPLECSTQACSAYVELGSKEGPSAPQEACTALACGEIGTCSTEPYSLDELEKVTIEWLYLACDDACQKSAGSEVSARQCASTWKDSRAPSWSITQIELSATSADGQDTAALASLGPRSQVPLVTLGGEVGSFIVYDRNDRPSTGADVRATGHLLKVTVTASTQTDPLPGATPQDVGTNACVAVRHRVADRCVASMPPAPGATECPTDQGWAAMNQRGSWSQGASLYTFLRFPGDPSTICGLDLAVLDWDPSSKPFAVDAVRVEAIEDPVGHWVHRYAEIARHVAGGRMGAVAFGSDFNGLNGMTDISELPSPAGTEPPSACPVAGDSGRLRGSPPLALAPMRFRNQDGSLGGEVLIEERGLATYGLLADLLPIIGAYPGCGEDVRASLMLSAEATIRAWEAIANPGVDAGRPALPTRAFACGPPPGGGP